MLALFSVLKDRLCFGCDGERVCEGSFRDDFNSCIKCFGDDELKFNIPSMDFLHSLFQHLHKETNKMSELLHSSSSLHFLKNTS